ncbi:hypothetical protein ACI3ET_01790 [Ornithinimicrobium sp. LYQ121]|uniref:hypothetical protein n=1 Tax=Ornithinimicrobium sp. LYQ121 TaxID=3378801 RepID=UPI003851D451
MRGRPQGSGTSTKALLAARVLAGLMGVVQLAGASFFLFVAPEEAVWLGPSVDVPVVGIMLIGFALKLVFALWPGLPVSRRTMVGLAAVTFGMVVTLLKIPLYDEPEGVVFLAVDALLLALLLLARRGAARPTLDRGHTKVPA